LKDQGISNLAYFEADFSDVTTKKIDVIKSQESLVNAVCRRAEDKIKVQEIKPKQNELYLS
jgi:hypothetical protein